MSHSQCWVEVGLTLWVWLLFVIKLIVSSTLVLSWVLVIGWLNRLSLWLCVSCFETWFCGCYRFSRHATLSVELSWVAHPGTGKRGSRCQAMSPHLWQDPDAPPWAWCNVLKLVFCFPPVPHSWREVGACNCSGGSVHPSQASRPRAVRYNIPDLIISLTIHGISFCLFARFSSESNICTL